MGRPSDFTQEIADTICERLACGESLRKICADDDMPAMSTIFRWLSEHQEFSEQYARAREAQADALFDEILDIADDGTNDFVGPDEKYNGDAVQRSKLRVDSRKWIASKLQPKKYGDATMIKHADANGEPIELDPVARATRLAGIMKQIEARKEGDE